jgi:hypothetical protein
VSLDITLRVAPSGYHDADALTSRLINKWKVGIKDSGCMQQTNVLFSK